MASKVYDVYGDHPDESSSSSNDFFRSITGKKVWYYLIGLAVIVAVLIIVLGLSIATLIKLKNKKSTSECLTCTTTANPTTTGKTAATTPNTVTTTPNTVTTTPNTVTTTPNTVTTTPNTVTTTPNTVTTTPNTVTTPTIPLTTASTTVTINTASTPTSSNTTTTVPPPTPGMIAAAKFLKQQINESADPCSDFYKFACGTWVANNPIPDDHQSWYLYQWIQDQNVQSLAELLKNMSSNDASQPTSVIKTKQAFDACVNYDPYLNNPYNKYLLNLIQSPAKHQGWGGWPIITPDWNTTESEYGPASYAGLMQSHHGVITIFNGYVDVDWKNVSQYILYVDQGQLELGSREIYLNQTLYGKRVNAYKNLIIQTANVLGKDLGYDVTGNKSQLETDAQAIIDLETKLAPFIVPDASRRNFSAIYNQMTVKQVKEMWPYINWDLYFFHILPNAFLNHVDNDTKYFDGFYALSNDSAVIIQSPEYIANLINILNQTDARTMANYFIWRFIKSLIPLMDNRTKPALKEFKEATEFVQDFTPKEKQCVIDLIYFLPWTVGRLFVNQKFTNMDRQVTKDVIGGAFDAMKALLNAVTWLDNRSTNRALTKLQNYVTNVGYPDWIMNDTLLDEYYSTLNLTYDDPEQQGNWYFIGQKLLAWAIEKANLKLKDPVDRFDFGFSPAVTDAWYNPWLNSVTIPAGFLQTPIFRSDFPKAVNYGSIGAIVGHEITHGFDDEGSQFYANGTLETWIDEQSAVGFRKMADCVVNQYSKYCYTDPPTCINGVNTEGENLADGGGLKQAFNAYQTVAPEQRLPGLEKYSMNQIFFISWSSALCGSARTEYLTDMLLLNPHTPAENRVNGALKSFDEFGKAFSCRQGTDSMYPAQQDICYIWTNSPDAISNAPGFLDAANILQANIDPMIDPCDDFYKHACGNFKNAHGKPDVSSLSTFSMVADGVTQTLIQAFENDTYISAQPDAVKKAKTVYDKCMHSQFDSNSNKQLLDDIMMFGGYPAINQNWNLTMYPAYKVVAMLKQMRGLDTLISSYSDVDFQNPAKYTLFFDLGSLGMLRQYYLNDTLFGSYQAAYKKTMINMTRILAQDNQQDLSVIGPQIEQDIDAVYNFEKQIAMMTPSQDQLRNISMLDNLVTIKGLQLVKFKQYGELWPWNKFAEYILPTDVFKYYSSSSIAGIYSLPLWMTVPDYVGGILDLVNSTDAAVVQNYLIWRYVQLQAMFLNKQMRDAFTEFYMLTNKVDDLPPGNSTCIGLIQNTLPYPTGRVFVDRAFPAHDKTKTMVASMVNTIIAAFKDTLSNLPWMDSFSKTNAIRKANNVAVNPMFPDFTFNDTALNSMYADMMINDGENFFNISNYLLQYQVTKNFELLLNATVPDHSDFHGSPATVNAWYYDEYNSITIPAGILQSPFYRSDFPHSVNYGAIGSVIGHELTHGFDDVGVQFDYSGAFNPWISNQSSHAFQEEAQCVVKEYSEICYPEVKLCIDGIQTQGENIADNGGIKDAFKAYMNWTTSQGSEEPRLPGFNKVTPQQLFFMAFANFWCGYADNKYIEHQLLLDPHSPWRDRVLVTLKNFDEFSKAFQCSPGDNMVKGDRCTVW